MSRHVKVVKVDGLDLEDLVYAITYARRHCEEELKKSLEHVRFNRSLGNRESLESWTRFAVSDRANLERVKRVEDWWIHCGSAISIPLDNDGNFKW